MKTMIKVINNYFKKRRERRLRKDFMLKHFPAIANRCCEIGTFKVIIDFVETGTLPTP